MKEEGCRLGVVASGRAETVRPVAPSTHVIEPLGDGPSRHRRVSGWKGLGQGWRLREAGPGRRLHAVGEGGRCWWSVFCICLFICTV